MLGPLALALALASVPHAVAVAEPSADPGRAGTDASPAGAPADPVPTPPPPPPPPPPPSPERQRTEAEEKDQEEENWLDASHAFIEHRLFAPVLRVDRFFSDERDLEAERSRSFLRWRNELRLVERNSTPGYTTSLSANLRLPGMNKQLRRLRVEVAGQTRNAYSALFPRDNVAPGEIPSPEENISTADAGVRFSLWDTLQTHGDLGAGFILEFPPGAYTRLRFRFAEPLGRKFLARQALTNFWRTDTGFGTTGTADLERPLGRAVLTRLTGSTTIHQESSGFEWLGDLSLLATIRERVGVQIGAGINGATSEPNTVDRYRVYTRLRRDFYRHWIFLEVEPEYGWPWTPELGRHSEWAVALRLEVQFRGNEPPPPAPPPAPEPSEPTPIPLPPAPGAR